MKAFKKPAQKLLSAFVTPKLNDIIFRIEQVIRYDG